MLLSNMEKVKVVNLSQNETEKSIEAGLKDLEDILSGNKTKKSLKQLLDED